MRLPRPTPSAAGLYALACAAFVGLALYIYVRYAIDFPRFDDFFVASFLEKVADGTVTLRDLLRPFNEHRVVVPRLLISTVAFTAGYNVRILLAITFVLMLVAWGVLAHLAWRQTAPGERTPLFYLVNAATCALVFSGMQKGGWLFTAWQPWFLLNAFFLLAVLAASPPHGRPGPLRLALAALACLAAAGSIGNGLLAGVALAPLLWREGIAPRSRVIGVFSLIAITAVIMLAYKQGIPSDRLESGLAALRERPLEAVIEILVLLGFPLLGLHSLAAAAGAVLVAIWGASAWDTLRDPASRVSQARLPWLAIGLFPLLCAPLVTVGRLGLDQEFAVHYRYVTFTLLLGVAAMQLAWLWWSHRGTPAPQHEWALYATAGALLCAISARSFDALETARAHEAERLHGARCLELVHYAPPDCIAHLDLTEPSLRRVIARLERSGTRKFATGLAFDRQPRSPHGYIDKPAPDRVIRLLRRGRDSRHGAVQVAGWAALPGRNKPADIVLFSYGEHDLFFASTVVRFDRRDVAGKLHMPDTVHSGWTALIDAEHLPPGPGKVYAWVYDRKGKRFVRLGGELNVFVIQ